MLIRLFAIFCAGCFYFANPLPSFAASPFAGSAPTNLGVHAGQLANCPSTPNCVVSLGGDAAHTIQPIHYAGDRQVAYDTLTKVLAVVPRTKIVEATPDYIRAESSSRLMGFVDDVEFYLPADEKVIQLRSASRLGESDLGVNQRRLEQIRLALKDLGIVSEISPNS